MFYLGAYIAVCIPSPTQFASNWVSQWGVKDY